MLASSPSVRRGSRLATTAAAAISLMLSGCVEPAPYTPGRQQEPFRQTASAAEREQAQALSLAGAAAPSSDPYTAAIECEAAVAMIADQFANTGFINEAQRRSLAAAQATFRARAEAAAATREITAEDFAFAREDARILAGRKRAASARTGLACLKSLVPEG